MFWVPLDLNKQVFTIVTLTPVGCRSSRFARLQHIRCSIAGKNLFIRFSCSTGDAMGMNMVSKGVQNVLEFLQIDFPDMEVIGISGKCLVIYFKLAALL